MRILLDECLPKDLARELSGHEVGTVPQAGWAIREVIPKIALSSRIAGFF